jgi:N-acetylglucosamine-6-sulfatase
MPLRYRLFAADNRKRGEADFRRIAANYYGMVHQVDLAVGQILAELEKQGLDGNTIVAFTSDHGEMLGAHGMLAKSVMYEESIKVPFFIRVPGVAPKRVPGATTNLHLTPTLLDLLDRHPAAPLAGRSLAPNLRSGKSTGEDVFIEWNPNRLAPLKQSAPDTIPGVPLEERHRAAAETQRAIVTQGGQKLVLSSNGHSHFFDLRRDPAELQNAFTDPARQQDIGRLRARLAAWRKTTQDTVKL